MRTDTDTDIDMITVSVHVSRALDFVSHKIGMCHVSKYIYIFKPGPITKGVDRVHGFL